VRGCQSKPYKGRSEVHEPIWVNFVVPVSGLTPASPRVLRFTKQAVADKLAGMGLLKPSSVSR
jgi:hypothetical protein